MIDEDLLEKARLHVRQWFVRRMPKHMLFHDLEHTLSVTRTARAIGQAMRVAPTDLAVLEMAALFHDVGYAIDPAQHEEQGAEQAAAFLEKHGVGQRDIARVKGLIMATRIGTRPRSRLQMILRDADSAKAGQIDFEEKSERLRREMEVLRGTKPSNREWLEENVAYLRGHRFHTAYARERYGSQKRLNLDTLRARTELPRQQQRPKLPLPPRYVDRDLSWLSFNDRVLQEAKDTRVPLLERIKFLAIYSNNLDEFYRVRVASLRSISTFKKTQRTVLDLPPDKLVERINRKALAQQKEFGLLYRGTLLPALAERGIRLLRENDLNAAQRAHVEHLFTERFAGLLHTATVRAGNAPFIEDRKLYFALRLRQKGRSKHRLVLLNIPSEEAGRFVELPSAKGRQDLIFLDDCIRLCLPQLFPGHKVLGCHAIKLSRDAELYLDEEFAPNVKEKVHKSLRKRRTGVPARFLYDATMPVAMLRALRALLGLAKQDLVAGGRYHNFSDLMGLPVKGHADLRDEPWPAVTHPDLRAGRDAFAAIDRRDVMLHFPYHDFGALLGWLQQAAHDPTVGHIAITLYRVADGSAVCKALLDALANGKRVTAFVEVQARFDEHSNLFWGETLEKAGAQVLYSYEGLKVHCKLCLVERNVGGRLKRQAYLGTGNFNEKTARIYVDSALLTAREDLTREVAEVFAHLKDRRHRPDLQQLLMAPTGLRDGLEALIDKEIELAQSGKPASILLKLNSLEDRTIINKLYDASHAGVHVRLIIRGICCLMTGKRGLSDSIEAISIVDRYLEHTRAYVFGNNGRPVVYLASADWMRRNLDHRIEVAFPVQDARLRREVLDMLELQWNDRIKARLLDQRQSNPYLPALSGKPAIRSQEAIHAYLFRRARNGRGGRQAHHLGK